MPEKTRFRRRPDFSLWNRYDQYGFADRGGNYICLPATHILTSGRAAGDLASGPPTAASPKKLPTRGCNGKAYCGNGGIPFPGMIGTAAAMQKITKQGYGFAQLSDGTSKTVLITESREENYTSWYSGFASYGVGAWPNNGSAGRRPRAVRPVRRRSSGRLPA